MRHALLIALCLLCPRLSDAAVYAAADVDDVLSGTTNGSAGAVKVKAQGGNASQTPPGLVKYDGSIPAPFVGAASGGGSGSSSSWTPISIGPPRRLP